jgi:hypothetical protein
MRLTKDGKGKTKKIKELNMGLLERIDLMLHEKIWSAKVKAKWTPPEDLFTKSAAEIAKVVAAASTSLKQAMSRITFYENRAGKNLTNERLKALDKAKELLRKSFA